MKDNKGNLGVLLVILAGCSWGLISIFIRQFDRVNMDTWDIMFYRSWVSVLLLLIYFVIKDMGQLRIELRDLWMFVGTGILSLTFFSYCYFKSIIALGTSVAVVLLYTSPIFILLMSVVIFKERITVRKLLAVALTFAGCILVAGIVPGSTGRITISGLILGLGAGFGYALYSIFAGFAMKKYSSITINFYTFLFSGIAVAFIRNPINTISRTGTDMIPWIIGISFVCTVFPYLTYTAGMKLTEVSKAAVLVTVEPLVGALIGILAWKEDASVAKLTGIILILSAVVILAIKDKVEAS